MRRRKQAEQEATTGAGRLTPADVQEVEFRLAFRGYNERDVDAFLDRITEELARYIEENERLRAGGGRPSGAAVVAKGDAAREAESIVARAREEAAAIVRRAEQQAPSVDAGSGGDARATVAPFLNTEREFLQNLGSLVQTHAEEIKQMVLALRERSREDVAIGQSSSAATRGGAGQDRVAEGSAASAAEIRQRLGDPEPDQPDSPVIIESATQPAFNSEGVPVNERRERSLRELFWGEEN
jgi:DivIVA domain-containing protein